MTDVSPLHTTRNDAPDLNDWREALSRYGCNPVTEGAGFRARCPGSKHVNGNRQNPPLHVEMGRTGVVVATCHAGCRFEDIRDALGLGLEPRTTGGIMPPPRKPQAPAATSEHVPAPQSNVVSFGQPTTGTATDTAPVPGIHSPEATPDREPDQVWRYDLEDGSPAFDVVRWNEPGGKIVRPRQPDDKLKASPAPRPLYHLPDFANTGSPVLVTEGEKTADAARDIVGEHYIVTTSSGGGGAARHTDWTPVAGRDVTIWPDADDAGAKYARAVFKLARNVGARSVAVVSTAGLPVGWDLAEVAPDKLDIEARLADAEARKRMFLTADPPAFGTVLGDLDPSPRTFLYGRHLIRGIMTMTVGDSGIGKSTHGLVEAVAMASGRNLLGVDVKEPLTVAVLNAEDTREEMARKLNGIMRFHQVSVDDLGKRLLLFGMGEWEPPGELENYDALESLIERNGMDVLILDPWVSMNRAKENANEDVDEYAKALSAIAARQDMCIEIVHHTRKPAPGVLAAATTDDARGASSLRAASRSARVFARMGGKEAKAADIDDEEREGYYHIRRDKANLAPVGKRQWFRFEVVTLPNGDNIGVPASCQIAAFDAPSDALLKDAIRHIAEQEANGERFRTSDQAHDWIGVALLDYCKLPDNSSARTWARKQIKEWADDGVLERYEALDANRHQRPYYRVAKRLDLDDTGGAVIPACGT